MKPTIDVYVLAEEPDSQTVPNEAASRVSMRLISTGVRSAAEFSQTPISSKLMEGDADFSALVFDTSPQTLACVAFRAVEIAGLAEQARQDPRCKTLVDSAHVMVERMDPCLFGEFLGRLDAYSVLLAPRACHGSVVICREALNEIGLFRPVGEPVWDWLIRAVRAGKKVGSAFTTADVQTSSRLPLLAPPRPRQEINWLLEHLGSVSPEELGGGQLAQAEQIAKRAGLFQWHDFLEESHELSQSIEGQVENQLGDYWHAIMHRREPDYSNAKYWFRRIGNQPAYCELRQHADAVLEECEASQAAEWRGRLQAGSKWNPLAFVDLCQECAADENSDLAIAARRIQYAEMCLLM
jgi:hypothetical protein